LPKITTVAACNDVLFDDEKNPSLISVFSALEAKNITGASIDPKTVAPRNWCLFTMWRAEREDLGKQFTQKMQVILPDGTEFGYGEEKITLDRLVHSVKMRIQGFPIGIQGDVTVKVWLEIGLRRETKITNLHINVKHLK
jgi:hypothetical protein